jgi:hypothetical protein
MDFFFKKSYGHNKNGNRIMTIDNQDWVINIDKMQSIESNIVWIIVQ